MNEQMEQFHNQYSISIISFHYIAYCSQGCQFGDCTAPNTCTCQSGWTGDSCNIGMISFNYIDYNECNAIQNSHHCGKTT